jgi:putative transposase
VWFQFWDTALTYEKSYLVRLNYVHSNAVHHQLVANAADYRWCSAAWFLETAPRAFLKTVLALRTDRVNVLDTYAPELPREMGGG